MKKILFMFICFFCSNVFAGAQSGKVATILVRDDGLHYFVLDGSPATGKPSCATIGYWMIKDENSTVGKSQFSMLLLAYASGKPIYVIGKNTCVRWGDGEDVSSITMGVF